MQNANGVTVLHRYQRMLTFPLGVTALWNAITKRKVVNASDPVLARLKEEMPEVFDYFVKGPRPAAMGDDREIRRSKVRH